MDNEILTWTYWATDKSEIIRNLGLVAAAFLALSAARVADNRAK